MGMGRLAKKLLSALELRTRRQARIGGVHVQAKGAISTMEDQLKNHPAGAAYTKSEARMRKQQQLLRNR